MNYLYAIIFIVVIGNVSLFAVIAAKGLLFEHDFDEWAEKNLNNGISYIVYLISLIIMAIILYRYGFLR